MINHLQCFVESADTGSFSAAGRRLALTSAAVGKNVTSLENQLGVRLFQRSTRKLTLTESGALFLEEVRSGLATIQMAMDNLGVSAQQPSGTLKVSMGTHFGMHYLLPLMDEFLSCYPHLRPDWQFDNRKVDLIGERFDAAIGGGFELAQGVVARELAPSHSILAASSAYLARTQPFIEPEDLSHGKGIRIRSPQTGRIRNLVLRDSQDRQSAIILPVHITVNEPWACCQAAVMGLGIAVASLPNLLPYLESGQLVRVLPNWYADNGSLSLYFPTHKMLPAKTRVFVDFIIKKFREQQLSRKFDARLMFSER